MADFSVNTIKEKYNAGVDCVNSTVNTLKDITVNPKIDASFTVKSKKNKNNLFDCKFKFDKEFSLFKLIGWVLAFLAALVTARIIINAFFSLFTKKSDKKTNKKKDKKAKKAKNSDIKDCSDEDELYILDGVSKED